MEKNKDVVWKNIKQLQTIIFKTQLGEDDKLLQYKEEETKGLFATLLRVVEKSSSS